MSNIHPPYKIIVKGIAKDCDADQVRMNLATRFKIKPEKLEPLFQKKSVVFKKTNNYQMALKYHAILKKCGVLCTICGTSTAQKKSKKPLLVNLPEKQTSFNGNCSPHP